MEKLDKITDVKVADQQTETDPRSKTTADKAFNLIGTGGPEEEVQGQGAVLAEKKDLKRLLVVIGDKISRFCCSKIYANRQRTKMAMSDAQLMHAEKMACGEEQYQGKLLEARQSDWKDEAVLIILVCP